VVQNSSAVFRGDLVGGFWRESRVDGDWGWAAWRLGTHVEAEVRGERRGRVDVERDIEETAG